MPRRVALKISVINAPNIGSTSSSFHRTHQVRGIRWSFATDLLFLARDGHALRVMNLSQGVLITPQHLLTPTYAPVRIPKLTPVTKTFFNNLGKHYRLAPLQQVINIQNCNRSPVNQPLVIF